MILRGVAYGLLLATLLLVETVVGPAVAVRGVGFDLTVLAVVGVGSAEGPAAGARFGFAAGLLRDLLAGAVGLLGPWMLAFLIVGYVAGVLRAYLAWEEITASALLGGAGALVAALVAGLLQVLLVGGDVTAGELQSGGGRSAGVVLELLLRVLVTTGWAVVLAPVVVRGTHRLAVRTRDGSAPVP